MHITNNPSKRGITITKVILKIDKYNNDLVIRPIPSVKHLMKELKLKSKPATKLLRNGWIVEDFKYQYEEYYNAEQKLK